MSELRLSRRAWRWDCLMEGHPLGRSRSEKERSQSGNQKYGETPWVYTRRLRPSLAYRRLVGSGSRE
jgi:hypothetical protein